MAIMAMEEEEGSESIDRISGLPEPVLHHILYFLTEDEAARTSTFSKSWRHIHSTRPKLVLWESLFAGDNKSFLFRVNATLQAHLHHNLPIERLFLGFSTLNSQSIPQIEKFAPILSTLRVKELFYLNTPPQNDDVNRHLIPNLPFEAFAPNSLQFLLLDGCNLFTQPHNTLPFNHLTKLRLLRVSMDEILPNKIMSICPSLRSFRFEECTGFKSINVMKEVSRSLSHFTVINEKNDTNPPDCSISIDAPHLEKIKIVFSNVRFLHSGTYSNLKALHLVNARLSRSLFNNSFPSLEYLTLFSCRGLDSAHLRIDAPKLKGFVYTGDSVPDIVLNHLGELSSEIVVSVPGLDDVHSWFVKLRKLLVALSRSKITLSVLNLLTEQEDDGFFLLLDDKVEAVVVEELQLGGHVACYPRVLKGLFGICHPRNLGHHWYLSNDNVEEMRREEREVVEYVYGTLDKRGDDDEIFQELDAVCFEIWESRGVQGWCPVEDTDVPHYVPPGDRNGEMTIRLGLDWRGYY